jgi:hypothetical protein
MGALAIAAVIAICIGFFIALKGTLDRRAQAATQHAVSVQVDRQACLRINNLYRLIQQQLRVSLKGLPTIKYYQAHPAELSAQIKRTKAEIKAFAPEKC